MQELPDYEKLQMIVISKSPWTIENGFPHADDEDPPWSH